MPLIVQLVQFSAWFLNALNAENACPLPFNKLTIVNVVLVLSMNVMKYFVPNMDGIGSEPHRSECTSCSGSLVLV